MNHRINTSFQPLTTERLVLKKVGINELEAYMPIAYYDGVKAASLARTKEIIEQINRDCKSGESIHWGIYFEENLIGTCGYYRGFKDEEGEVGCILKEAFRGKGFMYEALNEIITFGFLEVRLKQVIAYTTSSNEPALKLLNRLKFTLSATQTDECIKFEKTLIDWQKNRA